MSQTGADGRSRDAGFTLIELMVVVVIISLASAIAIPVLKDATEKARKNAFIAEGMWLYDAFNSYHVDEGKFPSEWGIGRFDGTNLNPLANEGYFPFAKSFLAKTAGNRIMLYLAPDIGTQDAEFIAVMRAAHDPNVIMVVARTGIVHSAGHFLDGVYLIDDGQLKEAGELN